MLRRLASKLVSDEWQLPIAIAAGVALLIGFSLDVLLDPEAVADGAAYRDLVPVFDGIGVALVWISLALGAIHGTKAALESLAESSPDIDVLMIVGAALAAAIGHPAEGALLLFMFTLAGALEHRALAKAKDAVARLATLMPDTALRWEGELVDGARTDAGRWAPVDAHAIVPGDRLLVRPGDTVPADAIIAEGSSTVDQSTLTGESLPRNVDPGDEVYAGTLNQNGAIEITVSRAVDDSALKRIMNLVLEAQEQQKPLQRLIDKVSTPYTLCVFGIAGLVFAYFWLIGPLSIADAAYRAITLLIVASPCALVIATPTATLCALNRAARAGVLVKGGDALERLARVRTLAMDKTGTLTTGRISVAGVRILEGDDHVLDRALPAVLALEERSTHPIAIAIEGFCRGKGATPLPVRGFEMVAGRGLVGEVEGTPARIGTAEFVAQSLDDHRAQLLIDAANNAREGGSLTAAYAHDGDVLLFVLSDTLRDGAAALVRQLKGVGVERLVMLTGDHQVIATRTANELAIDEAPGDLKPEDKVDHVRALAEGGNANGGGSGGVALIGDGVHDAPALATADLGIAMGGIGADAALESADIVLLNDDLATLPWAIGLAKRTNRVMRVNLTFAMGVIAVLAAFAVAGVIPMGLGVIGHEGSTLIVVANSLQILAMRPPTPLNGASNGAGQSARPPATAE